MINKKSENTIPNIWTAQENLLHFYRILAAGLAVLAVFLLSLTIVIYFRDPIVVVKSAGVQEFYPSKRAKSAPEKVDIEAFAKNFLAALYVWPEFNADRLAREISPYAENGFVSKVTDAQSQKYGKELKGKKLAQAITFVEIDLLDDRVLARFDRVLKIEGIPLVIRTEATLSMIQGAQTRLNPMGIYVAGIQEREGAK